MAADRAQVQMQRVSSRLLRVCLDARASVWAVPIPAAVTARRSPNVMVGPLVLLERHQRSNHVVVAPTPTRRGVPTRCGAAPRRRGRAPWAT